MAKKAIRMPDVIAIVVAVAVIAILFFAFRGFIGSSPAGESGEKAKVGETVRSYSEQAELFMGHLQSGDLAAAYSLLTAERRAEFSGDEFATAIKQNGRFSNIRQVEIKRVDLIEGEGWIEYFVRSDAGRIDVTVRLQSDDSDEWRIAGLVAAGAPALPSASGGEENE